MDVSKAIIRNYRHGDAPGMQEVLKPYIETTAINFEYECPALNDFQKKIDEQAQRYPCLVLESEGTIIGYAYASEFRTKRAYAWCTESTIYLSKMASGHSLGKLLYQTLLEALMQMGFTRVYGGVTLPNPASCRLHESLGFDICANFEDIGYKFGKWHSIVFYSKQLNTHHSGTPPLSVAEAEPELNAIIARSNESLTGRQKSKIRKAEMSDVETIKEITCEAYATLKEVMDPFHFEQMMQSISEPEKYLYLLNHSQAWICEYEGKAAGVVFLMNSGHDFKLFNKEHAVVRLLGVRPGFRGSGIARLLMETLVRQAVEDNEKCLALHTSEKMREARKLYERLGFKIHKELQPIWGMCYSMYHLNLKSH